MLKRLVWRVDIHSEKLQFFVHKIISLSDPIQIEGSVCHIGTGIRVARYPVDGDDLEAILRAADQTIYQVKHRGKNAVAVVS